MSDHDSLAGARRRFIGAAGASALVAARPSWAQSAPGAGDFPKRAVRMVVPFAPGGATDLVGRLLAGKLSDAWGQSVIVENRAGASGIIGTETVARAPADGHTLLVAITTHIQNPSLFQKLPFDPYRDFAAVSQICLSYLVLVVKPDFPANTLKEFVAYCKAHPGTYTFGSFGTASSSHVVGEGFGREAGLQVNHVAYKGSSPMLTDLLGGQIKVGWADVSTATAHIAAGRLKPLAVSGPARAPMLPQVPTLAESGYPGFEPLGWVGVLVAAATPRPVVDQIARELIRITNLPEVKQRLLEQTLVPVGSTPEAFTRTLRDDGALWARMIQNAGITPQ